MQLDLMRTWSATPRQVLTKLRWPSAVPYLFASLKVAITISLIGAIVAELPTGAEAGIGARLLAGSYYGQTIQIWSALLASAILASGPDRAGEPDRARRGAANGDTGLNPQRLRLGFILAVAGLLAALVLPLSSEAVAHLPARPIPLALIFVAVLLFAIAAGVGGSRAIAPGIAGVLCAAATTLALLRDPGIAGSAAVGFWIIMLAAWLGAALCVVQLASLRPRDGTARRAINLAVPLLFGAVVFYLWEVLVRGFGVPAVIMPAPSAAAARFVASLPILGQISSRPSYAAS